MKSQIEAAMHHDGGDEISANRMSSHDVVTPSKFSYCCRKKVSGHGHEELSDEEIAEVLRRTIAGDTTSSSPALVPGGASSGSPTRSPPSRYSACAFGGDARGRDRCYDLVRGDRIG
jgi:hypothetical protein